MRIKKQSQFGFHADFIIGIRPLLFFKEDSAKTDE